MRLKILSLFLGNAKQDTKWHKWCYDIDNIQRNDEDQIFEMNFWFHTKEIVDEQLCWIKLAIINNHGDPSRNCSDFT